jgi:hypothetical protein
MGTYRWHIGGKSQRAVDLVHQVHNQVPVWQLVQIEQSGWSLNNIKAR